MIGRRFPSHPSDVLGMLHELGDTSHHRRQRTACQDRDHRRPVAAKVWTDTQALGNIENAILKDHVANRVEHRKPGKP